MGEAEAARAPRTEADVATRRLQMSEVTVSVGADAPSSRRKWVQAQGHGFWHWTGKYGEHRAPLCGSLRQRQERPPQGRWLAADSRPHWPAVRCLRGFMTNTDEQFLTIYIYKQGLVKTCKNILKFF